MANLVTFNWLRKVRTKIHCAASRKTLDFESACPVVPCESNETVETCFQEEPYGVSCLGALSSTGSHGRFAGPSNSPPN